jgi:DNA-nicking Smr family endonuclease
MTRRKTSDTERAEFETAFQEARPLKSIVAARATRASAAKAPSGVNGSTAEAMRRGTLEPEARLDLHGMTETVAHRALATFLRGAQSRALRLIIVVTGKSVVPPPDAPFVMDGGRRGVLKTLVPRWLKEPDLTGFIADIRTAHRRHGGDGALYVYLRKGPR